MEFTHTSYTTAVQEAEITKVEESNQKVKNKLSLPQFDQTYVNFFYRKKNQNDRKTKITENFEEKESRKK